MSKNYLPSMAQNHIKIQDYAKPMGVATYKTSKDMSDELRKALPDVEALSKLLDDQGE